MLRINADLHIHGRFSAGTSNKLTLADMALGAKAKGIQMLATGDILHPEWRKELEGKDFSEVDEGTYEYQGVRLILSTEVEDNRRVHHLIFFPSLSKVREFGEAVEPHVTSLSSDGRPHVRLDGEAVAVSASDCGAVIGPCHAFTPWTAMYAYHPNLGSCYGDMKDRIGFLELGLSADSSYGDRIKELQDLTFLTNSDAHSAPPYRLAREFNRLEVKDATFGELKKALAREGGRRVCLNVGLPPQEGKYNESACIKCYRHYAMREAQMRHWKCKCGGRIKMGVRDRVNELADWDEPRRPEHRPGYVHTVPLSNIIANAVGISTLSSKTVQGIWDKLVRRFGSEPVVLIDAPLEEIKAVDGIKPRVTEAVVAFRTGKARILPGGGGEYGKVVMPWDKEYPRGLPVGSGNIGEDQGPQRSLFDFN